MKALRDPLLHFLILGAALLAIYALAAGVFTRDALRRIEIDDAQVAFLAGTFERQWGRAPTPEELRRLVEARVREEVLYREALAVGLDRDDTVVRRRMVQKMELLTEDVALLADPTEEELRSFFEEKREEYRIPPRLSFSHVYLNVDRRGAAAEEEARRLLAELRAERLAPRRAPERGDPIMIESDYTLLTPAEVARVFGRNFAEALFEFERGWQGPVVSGFGLHLVHVGERVESRLPDYAEVRSRLVEDFNRRRRERAKDALFEGLARGYEVVLDGEVRRVSDLVGSAEEGSGS
jgi:hypothetical protein